MIVIEGLEGNGPVCQVENLPAILLAYRAHPVTIVYKTSAADTWRKGVKKLPKFLTYSSNSRHRACVCDGSAPSSGAVLPGAF
jgi:hypothetical protein